jgi:hypothetical protein
MRRRIRFPQWWMLWGAILAILSARVHCWAEHFAKRHYKTLNQLLGTHVSKPPSDSTFRLLLAQLDVEQFEAQQQQRQWMGAQPGVANGV